MKDRTGSKQFEEVQWLIVTSMLILLLVLVFLHCIPTKISTLHRLLLSFEVDRVFSARQLRIWNLWIPRFSSRVIWFTWAFNGFNEFHHPQRFISIQEKRNFPFSSLKLTPRYIQSMVIQLTHFKFAISLTGSCNKLFYSVDIHHRSIYHPRINL